MKLSYLLILFIFLCSSCKYEQKEGKKYNYSLLSTGKIKSFPLDSETRYNMFYMYVFEDENNRNYLSFLNYGTNQILFYDFETNEIYFKSGEFDFILY